MTRLFLTMVAAAGLALAAWAANLANLTEADRQRLNEWMAQRAEIMVEAHRLNAEVRQAWTDPALTSPAIEALRARHRELQEELLKTQRDIEQEIATLPPVRKKLDQLETLRNRERELASQIEKKIDE